MEVGQGGRGNPGREGRRVGAVLCVKDKVHVQQISGLLVRLLAGEHVQEVAGVVEARVRGYRLQPQPQPVVGAHDGRTHGGQPESLANSGFRRIIVDLRIESSQGRNTGAQGVHRVAGLHQV